MACDLLVDSFAIPPVSWGIDPLIDQTTAGGIIWAFGELPILNVLLAVVIPWARADRRAGHAADRRVDRDGRPCSRRTTPTWRGSPPRARHDRCDRGCIATVVSNTAPGEWVLLHYRLPREPSTPRIAVWRQLRRLGVAQLSDGLVALPADARTREQLEWVAAQVLEAAGTAGVWLAAPASISQERDLAAGMTAARAVEYVALALVLQDQMVLSACR